MTDCFLCEEKADWYDTMNAMYLCDDCKERRVKEQYERIGES